MTRARKDRRPYLSVFMLYMYLYFYPWEQRPYFHCISSLHVFVQGVPKKLTNRKKLSAVGPNFLMSMTWERLILLRLGKKQPKNIFPDTGAAGY